MHLSDATAVLDKNQLRNITLDDPELMREILSCLIDDTSRQLAPLESAIQARNGTLCARLAHYSKGACANVGANTTAILLKTIERRALSEDFDACAVSLTALAGELTRLRQEAAGL